MSLENPIITTNLDADSDSPRLARVQLKESVDFINTIPEGNSEWAFFDALDEAKLSTSAYVGQKVVCKDYSVGNNAGLITGQWVATGVITPDSGNPAHNSLPLVFKQSFGSTVSVKQYGLKGDGLDDPSLLATIATTGRIMLFPDGTYYGNPVLLSEGTKWRGEDMDKVIIDIPTDRNEVTIWIKESNCSVENMTIRTTMSNIGSGTNGTMVTVGLGTSFLTSQDELKNTILRNLKGVNLGEPCNAITVIGNVSSIEIDNIEGDGYAQGVVCHWGSNRNLDLTFIESYYPNNITLGKLSFKNLDFGGLFISACYNVTLDHMSLKNCGQVLSVIAGDSVGAPATINDNILKNITLDNIYAYGLTGSDCITIDGEGHEPTSDLWGRVDMGSVSLSNIYMDCLTATDAINITDSNGVKLRDVTVDMAVASSSSVACSVILSKSVTIDNLVTSAPTPLRIDRASNVKVDGMKADNKLGTASFGVDIRGIRYSDNLSANVNIGDTVLPITTLFPLRVYRGDVVRLTSDPTKFAVVSGHYADTTSIAVEPLTFAATSGDSVFLDTRTKGVSVKNSQLLGYSSGITDASSYTSIDILDITAKDNTISVGTTNPISLTKTINRNLAGNKFDDGTLVIYPFSPAFTGVIVTYTNQDGKYYVQDGICYFEIEIDYTGLDTADPSAIQITNLPLSHKDQGRGTVSVNTYLSTGLTLLAADSIQPMFWISNANMIFADSSGALVAYNSGKIAAAGKILLSGSFLV